MKSLSIVIPAYNEGKRIGNTLKDYLGFFGKRDFEIIVVLNGCKDNTLSIVKKFSKSKNLHFKNFPQKLGKGGAVIEGFKLARKEYISYVDADGSTKAKDFYEIFEKINGFDGIIASRYVEGSVISKKQSLGRIIASRGFNFLVRLLFNFPFKDTQCGAKIFRKEVIKKVLPFIGTTGWAFDIDILFRANSLGFKIIEVPTTWSNVEGSKLNMRKTVPAMFLSVIRLRLLSSRFRSIVPLMHKISQWFSK